MAVSLAVMAGAGVPHAVAENSQVSVLYKQGLIALQEGEADLARQSFVEALRLDPQHINSRIQLDRLKNRSGELAAIKRKNQLAQIVIPTVDYDEVTLPEALEAMTVVIKKETDGKFAPNFIIQDPGNHLSQRPVSLQLNNVPASVVLKHLLGLAQAKERYDEYAIVIKPLNTKGTSPSSTLEKIE